jgi:hypothetical protein
MMVKKVFFYSAKSRESIRDLQINERLRRKDEQYYLNMAKNERIKADECLREINYRLIPKAQEWAKDLVKLKRIVDNHNTGKAPISQTKLKATEKAIGACEQALENILLYGESLREKPELKVKQP